MRGAPRAAARVAYFYDYTRARGGQAAHPGDVIRRFRRIVVIGVSLSHRTTCLGRRLYLSHGNRTRVGRRRGVVWSSGGATSCFCSTSNHELGTMARGGGGGGGGGGVTGACMFVVAMTAHFPPRQGGGRSQ